MPTLAHTERTKKVRAQLLAFVAEESLKISAMVPRTTEDVVQKALQTVATKTVLACCTENIGQSVQAKRKEAFVSHDKTEQKRDQFSAV